MKRIALIIAAAVAAFSCSPLTYPLELQLRTPSVSGLDPSGKTMAVVYLEDGTQRDSLFNNCVADGLAQGLETMYFDSEKALELYDVKLIGNENYTCADSLRSLVMQTGADVIYLIDSPVYSGGTAEKVDCRSTVYVYDSMDKRDTVLTVSRSGKVSRDISDSSLFLSDAMYMGLGLSENFKVNWTDARFTLIYFDDLENGWIRALNAIEGSQTPDWAAAISEWTKIFENTSNACRRSCAAYNIAIGCFLEGETALASEWLDLSDSLYPISSSASLRKRIASRY